MSLRAVGIRKSGHLLWDGILQEVLSNLLFHLLRKDGGGEEASLFSLDLRGKRD